MLMYSEKRRPREGRAPCLGEPHRARTAFGLRKARAYPGTAPSDSAAPELRKLLSSSCPRAAPHPSPLLGAAFHQPRAPIGALHQAPQPSQRHVTSLPRSLLQLGAASAGFLEGRGGRKWQRRRAEVGGRVRTRVVRRCRSHGGARRAAAGGPRAGAGAAGAGRPLHARGDQVGRPPGRWGRPCAEVPVLMAPCLLSYRAVLKKATALEYKIQRRALRKEDFINYIQVGCAD